MDFKISSHITPKRGSLLIASPLLDDPHFARSVVVVFENNEEGTLGYIINKPRGFVSIQSGDHYADQELPVYEGGPVAPGTLQLLHIIPKWLGGELIIHDLHIGGDLTNLGEYFVIESEGENRMRFIVGYSGWSPGQLSQEIAENSWIVMEEAPDDLLTLEPDKLWRLLLQMMGGNYKVLANFPEDPNLN